nr:hypothetical protein [Tanacetum cinerariifolium]
MDKVRQDRRKDVHTRLDFGEGLGERTREDSHHSSARARTTKPEWVKVQDRLRYDDRHVLDRLGHWRKSAFNRLSKTYSPSTTKSRPRETDSRDPPRGRSHTHGLNTSREDRPKDRECFNGLKNHIMILSPTPIRSRSKRHKSTDEDDLMKPWMCEEEDPFTPRIRNFESSRKTRMPNNVKTVWFDELPPESIDGYKDLKAAFLAYFMQQKKYVKDPVEIHNIKQKDGETIEDFMELNNPELTKRLNEHVPKTMEEMMITTTAFIRGEAAASKKKGHASWKAHDQSKRQNSDKRSDFRGHSREGRGSNRFTPLTRTPKEILAAEAGKFQPPPPMVTPVEKRSSNKFCDFHNDKGHNTNEWMQLKKQIEELVRAGKLPHLIKEIKHGRGKSKTGKNETTAKDKPTTIYMIQSWQRTTRKKVTQSFKRVKEITFPPQAAKILYEHCFNRLRPEINSQMVLATTSLTGFSGENIWPLGQLRLLVIIGDTNHSTRAWMNFMIIRSLSPYNGIIGRSRIRAIQTVSSTVHRMLKFPVEGGIVTILSTVLIPTECTSVITSSAVSREERTRSANFKVTLHPDFPDQEVAIGGTLSDKGRTELCSILKKNLDIFAWQPSDMTGVPRSVAKHHLNIREGYSPVRQKKRGQAPERAKAIQAEVKKLVEAGTMRELYYHDWLSNPVMVKKHDGSWRMCVEFTDLNKACLQDCYPLSGIDWKVESLCGYPFKCFLDAYKVTTRYSWQNQMKRRQLSTLGKGPKKCSFGLAEGMFLGYVVTPEGIKPCPDKTAAVLQLPSPRTIKEVQSLNGKLASLNRFLSKSADKSLPLFQTLKKCIKKSDFHWTAEAEQAFKQHLSELPLLVVPKPKEELIIYLSATYGAISAVLMTERGTQRDFGGEHNITYRPRTSVKGQILAEILIEMPGENPQAAPAAETQQELWTLFTDGSSCVDGSGAGLILTNPKGIEFTYALRFQFATSNNEAECEALIASLRIAARMGVKDVHVRVDSKLVVNQVLRTSTQRQIHKREGGGNSDRGGQTDLDDIDSGLFKRKNSPRRQKGGKKAPPQGPTIRVNGKNSLQAVVPYAVAKWIEAKTVATITGGQVKKFVWDNIVCRFGIPGEIVSDNSKQFSDNPFKDWCDKLNITQWFASVKHPQSNRLVERANRSLGEGIKSRLGEGNKNWVEELSHVLWAHRTMIRSSHVDVVSNDEELQLNLDLLEERHERAAICDAKAKSKMTKYYNARVRSVTFKPGDFVYRSKDASHAVAGGKL